MTLDEMKLAVCGKLPELFYSSKDGGVEKPCWKDSSQRVVWAKEGLQVCHEAEKLLTPKKFVEYKHLINFDSPYEQRLEAICRVWWPERF